MIFYGSFVTLYRFYDFRPPISNFMIFYDFMLAGTTEILTITIKSLGFLHFPSNGKCIEAV